MTVPAKALLACAFTFAAGCGSRPKKAFEGPLKGQAAGGVNESLADATRATLAILEDPSAAARQTINVATSEGLLAAIGSNRVVRLAPGTYEMAPRLGRNGLDLREVRNLTIEGTGQERARVVVNLGDWVVIYIHRAENIELANIEIGHVLPEAMPCHGSCVFINEASDISIRNCLLFGCGSTGVFVTGHVDRLVVADSVITDCEYAVQLSGNAVFTDTSICKNRTGNVIRAYRDSRVRFVNCRFESNRNVDPKRGRTALFRAFDGAQIVVEGGRITGNSAYRLAGGDVRFDGTTMADNDFDREKHVRPRPSK